MPSVASQLIPVRVMPSGILVPIFNLELDCLNSSTTRPFPGGAVEYGGI